MKKLKQAGAIALAAAFSCGTANAFVFDLDFVAQADNPPGEQGIEPLIVNDAYGAGQTVTITAGNVGPSTGYEAVPYLDSSGGAGPAGLGVCSTGLTTDLQCIDSGDDNVTEFEYLTFEFSDYLDTAGFTFNKYKHGPVDPSKTLVVGFGYQGTAVRGAIGADVFTGGIEAQFAQLASLDFSLLPPGTIVDTITFGFVNGGGKNNQFYIGGGAAQVPSPGSLALLGAGLLAMGAVTRRRTNAKKSA